MAKALKVTLVFASLAVLTARSFAQSAGKKDCPRNETYMPADIDLELIRNNQIYDGRLQIFRNWRINCDGYIVQWTFIPRTNDISGLHFAVFRERKRTQVFDIVGETYLDNITLNEADYEQGWVTYPAPEPIEVRVGDVLGIFYDNYLMNRQLLSIGSEIVTDPPANFQVTLVLYQGAAEGLQNGAVVNAANAQQFYRIPALAVLTISADALEDYLASRRRPAMPPSTTATKRTTKAQGKTTPRPKPTTTEALLQTLPKSQSGIIPHRCLAPVSRNTRCPSKIRRIYYDYNFGSCVDDYGCPTFNPTENSFSSIQECIQFCTSLL